jgi:hypothetical protein
MVGAPAIRWVVALKSEAKPIIEELQMLPMEKGMDFPIYSDRNRCHWLIISGVGQSRSAAATNYLHRESDAPPWSAWINIGIAGYGYDSYGALYLVDKIVSEETSFVAYPGVALATKLPRSELLTVNKPKVDYSEPSLIDMEGYAFYEAAIKFSCRELLLLLKVVSDGPKSNVKILTPKKISKLILNNIENILVIVRQLENLSKLEFTRLIPPDICNQIKQKWHFTVTQKHQLTTLVRRWTSVFPETTLFQKIKNQKNSKSVISSLSKDLDEYKVDWGKS